jgi:Cytochrome C and Quinol oxidase polypeptide I
MGTTVEGVQATVRTHRLQIRHLALANIGVAIVAFGIGAGMALMQALSRANLDLPFRTPDKYYMSVTTHGTLMALVFTTFFIMGFGYAVAERTLERPVPFRGLAWGSLWLAVAGTLATVVAILAFKATVLYTFYPPLKVHPAFYIGLTLVAVGSWGGSAVMLTALRQWSKQNRGRWRLAFRMCAPSRRGTPRRKSTKSVAPRSRSSMVWGPIVPPTPLGWFGSCFLYTSSCSFKKADSSAPITLCWLGGSSRAAAAIGSAAERSGKANISNALVPCSGGASPTECPFGVPTLRARAIEECRTPNHPRLRTRSVDDPAALAVATTRTRGAWPR